MENKLAKKRQEYEKVVEENIQLTEENELCEQEARFVRDQLAASATSETELKQFLCEEQEKSEQLRQSLDACKTDLKVTQGLLEESTKNNEEMQGLVEQLGKLRELNSGLSVSLEESNRDLQVIFWRTTFRRFFL
jgi:hypothetical protein